MSLVILATTCISILSATTLGHFGRETHFYGVFVAPWMAAFIGISKIATSVMVSMPSVVINIIVRGANKTVKVLFSV